MAIIQLGDDAPSIAAGAWVADSAQVIGRVTLGKDASVWYGVVLRGDNARITIGESSNVQDGCVLHTDLGKPLTIGAGVTVGHMAALHSCSVGDNTLIGIGAVILNGASIGRDSIVGAGALVTERKQFPDGVLIVGTPARVVRELTPAQIDELRADAEGYLELTRRHRTLAKRIA